jgi:hypothetical protein
LPLLVDDGSKAYLHADGLLAEIDAANAATYPLGDILGSVRGLTNGSGTVPARRATMCLERSAASQER